MLLDVDNGSHDKLDFNLFVWSRQDSHSIYEHDCPDLSCIFLQRGRRSRIGYGTHSSRRQESQATTKQNMNRPSPIRAKIVLNFAKLTSLRSNYSGTSTSRFSGRLRMGPRANVTQVNNFLAAMFPNLKSLLHSRTILVGIGALSHAYNGNTHNRFQNVDSLTRMQTRLQDPITLLEQWNSFQSLRISLHTLATRCTTLEEFGAAPVTTLDIKGDWLADPTRYLSAAILEPSSQVIVARIGVDIWNYRLVLKYGTASDTVGSS